MEKEIYENLMQLVEKVAKQVEDIYFYEEKTKLNDTKANPEDIWENDTSENKPPYPTIKKWLIECDNITATVDNFGHAYEPVIIYQYGTSSNCEIKLNITEERLEATTKEHETIRLSPKGWKGNIWNILYDNIVEIMTGKTIFF